MSEIRRYLVILIIPFTIWWLVNEARRGRAESQNGKLIFRTPLALRLIYGIGVLLFASLSVFVFTGPNFRHEWWTGVGYLLLLLLGLFSWPAAIILDESGIYKATRWRRNKKLLWKNVSAAVYRQRDRSTIVYGDDGSTLSISQFHVDTNRLHGEILKRSGLPKIAKDSDFASISGS